MGDAGNTPNCESSRVPKVGYPGPYAETFLLSENRILIGIMATVNKTERGGPGGSELSVLETGVASLCPHRECNSVMSRPTPDPKLPSADVGIYKAPFASRP